jgi:uncharacterized protein YlxW (UPF0749 family)
MNPLTLRELELRRAQLAERAEKRRQEWRSTSSVSPRALSLGKEVKALQERADDLAALLRVAEGMT